MTLVKITDTTSQLSELVKRVNSERELIILTTDGQARAVLLGLEAFEDLLGMREDNAAQKRTRQCRVPTITSEIMDWVGARYYRALQAYRRLEYP